VKDVKSTRPPLAQVRQRDHRNLAGCRVALQPGHDLAITLEVQNDDVGLKPDRGGHRVVAVSFCHRQAGVSQMLEMSLDVSTIVYEEDLRWRADRRGHEPLSWGRQHRE